MARDERQWRRGTNRHPTGLVALERSICLEFVFENPLASYNIGLSWPRKKFPGVGEESGVLGFHCCTPAGVNKSGTIAPRKWRQWCSRE
jgi:hypothetical protein